MRNDIRDHLGSLLGLLNTGLSLVTLKLNLLDHAIDDVSLADVVLTLSLVIFHDRDDHEGELAELIERNLDLLGAFITLVNLLLMLSVLHIKIHLITTSQLLLLFSLTVDLFLDISELNVSLDNVDVRVAHKTADLSDVDGLDFGVAVSASHALAQSDETFELTDGYLVRGPSLPILLILSHSLELFLEHVRGLLSEARLDSAAELDVGLHLLS